MTAKVRNLSEIRDRQCRGEGMGVSRDDDNVLTSLQFHDDGFEADDHITIRFASTIAIIILVIIAGLEVFRILVCDLLILPQRLADTSKEDKDKE